MRLRRCLLCALLVVVACLGWPQSAAAQVDRSFTRYDQTVTLAADGTATVVLDAELDFSREPGHGPVFTYITQMDVPGEQGRYRIIDIDDFTVTSPSGASVSVQRSSTSNTVTFRIGSESQTYSTPQSYTISYTLRGAVQPDQAVSGLDEFNWNAVGTSGDLPIVNPVVTLTGPDGLARVSCFSGADFTTPCSADRSGATATFRSGTLAAGEGMQVTAGWPVGTFVGAEPRYGERLTPGRAFPLGIGDLGGAGLVAAGGALALVALVRRHRDRAWQGLTPGDSPVPGSDPVPVGVRDSRTPVAVRFNPPDAMRPGEASLILTKWADDAALSATLIDLAVRGHLRIEEKGSKNWVFTRTLPSRPDPLLDYEATVLDTLFKGGQSFSSKKLKASQATVRGLSAAKSMITDRGVEQYGWFQARPMRTVARWAVTGLLLAGIGIAATVGLAFLGLALIGVVITVLGLVLAGLSLLMPARTPAGSAALAQVEGFRRYIATAEADQLRWEEGEDIFSRYLPWAIAFKEAERWTAVFAELAAQGRYQPQFTWYSSPYSPYLFMSGFSDSITSMTSAMQDMVTSASHYASSGSSAAMGGGSGFSGGGGFGGGGAGSW